MFILIMFLIYMLLRALGVTMRACYGWIKPATYHKHSLDHMQDRSIEGSCPEGNHP